MGTRAIRFALPWSISCLVVYLIDRLRHGELRTRRRIAELERQLDEVGTVRPPDSEHRAHGQPAAGDDPWEEYQRMQDEAIRRTPTFPAGRFSGAGIVMVAGGMRYFTNAWVAISLLRRVHSCTLPIQVWYRGPDEMSDTMIRLLQTLDVECVDAAEVRREHPVRRLGGYECKPYAILHCPFRDVILLDADNVPLIDPTILLSHAEYRRTGAVFWPDIYHLNRDASIWEICRVPYRLEPEVESGQIVVDKERCWAALYLTMHLNEWSDFYYRHIRGDKDTFHMAWRMLGRPYSMPRYLPRRVLGRCTPDDAYLNSVLEQHDFDGRVIFQHRTGDAKWNAWGTPFQPLGARPLSFRYDDACLAALDELRRFWSGSIVDPPKPVGRPSSSDAIAQTRRFLYRRIGDHDRVLEFLPDGSLAEVGPERWWWQGGSELERTWRLDETGSAQVLTIAGEHGVTCRLTMDADGVWRGRWYHYEQIPVELIPLGR